MARAATRWGIVSAGAVSNDFVRAIRSCDPAEHEIVAVAARKLENAQEFGKKFRIPISYGSYEELSKDPRVEIVYVATIHMHHAAVSEMMMKAGKHVLCEKPMTMNKKEAERVLATARQHNVFFMEGFWTRFFPAIFRLREELAQGTIGEARISTATVGFNFPNKGWNTEKGGGILLAMGCYCTMLARTTFLNAKLERIVASGTLTEKGVEDFVSATLYFDEGRVAQFVVSSTTTLGNTATIYGSNNKYVKLPIFWAPDELITADCTQTFPLPSIQGVDKHYSRSDGFVYELEAVRGSLLKGELENPLVSHKDSLWIMEVLDEIRRQIGVTFDADLE